MFLIILSHENQYCRQGLISFETLARQMLIRPVQNLSANLKCKSLPFGLDTNLLDGFIVTFSARIAALTARY